MRVLCLTTGPETEPSSRFRFYQYAAPLRRQGIELELRPRVGRGHLAPRPTLPARIAAVGDRTGLRTLRRARDLVAARRYDAVWVQKESFALGLDRLVAALPVPVILDVGDSLDPRPREGDGPGSRARRAAERLPRRERALARLLPRCAAVWAGSPALADYARARGARAELVPSVVDTDAYPVRLVRRRGPLTLGWFGAPTGGGLELLQPVFAALARRFPLRLVVRGVPDPRCPGVEVEERRGCAYHTPRREAAELDGIDVGLVPLPEGHPRTDSRCAFEAIRLMASGIPVVVSPVGTSAEAVLDGVTGFHATRPADWRETLTRLLESPTLRLRLGRAGRAHVEAHYALSVAAPRVAGLLREVRCAYARASIAR